MLRNRLMGVLRRVIPACIPGMSAASGTITTPFSLDSATQKVSVTTNSLNGSMGDYAQLNGSFDFSSGKTSFEFKSRFDVMGGGGPSDYIKLAYRVQRSGIIYAYVEFTHYENGKYRLLIIDKSGFFPAMYNTGEVSSIPMLVTMIFDASLGTFSIKADGSTLTLGGDNTFPAASGYEINAHISYYGINAAKSADAQIITSKAAMLYGEGKDLCGNTI